MKRITIILLVAACSGSPKRVEQTQEQLEAERVGLMTLGREVRREIIQTVLARMEVESKQESPVFDMLIVHGGRDYGAFGAGFLHGWAEAQGDAAMPVFDLTTGTSSGALLAPYAMIGRKDRIKRIYELHKNPQEDWFKKDGLFFFWPSKEATFNGKGLFNQIRTELSLDVAQDIARERAKHKQLLIGTTNADHGLLRIWPLGVEAQKAADGGDLDRLHRIVIASLSLPVVFPPVEIDGGLYVDGATTQQMFLGLDVEEWAEVLLTWMDRHPNRPPPKFRIWVIINGKLRAHSMTVQRRWLKIGMRALAVMLDAGRTIVLRRYPTLVRLMNSVPGVEAEFRYVQIPEDWVDPADPMEMFDKTRMNDLAEIGYRMGREGNGWKQDVPSSRWPSKMPKRPQ